MYVVTCVAPALHSEKEQCRERYVAAAIFFMPEALVFQIYIVTLPHECQVEETNSRLAALGSLCADARPGFAIECDECVQHQCHGHLIQLSGLSHVCVLCQFLTLPLVVATVAAILLYNVKHNAPFREHYVGILSALVGIVGLRAPPCLSPLAW